MIINELKENDRTMYKLIVSDIDETLIDTKGNLSQKNLQAIQQAQKLGVKFVPSTGRSFNNFQHILKQTGVHDLAEQYSISYNGGVITENKNNKLLSTAFLPAEIVIELFQLGLDHNLLIHLFTLDDIITYAMNEDEEAFLEGHIKINHLQEANIDHLKDTPILKINFQHLDRQFLQSIEESLTPDLKDLLDINYSSNRYIEFNPKGIHKGNALLKLMDLLNIKPEEVLSIGDNMNDRTMIEVAGTGVAVANAVPELLERADYICEKDHNNSAVAEAIHKFIL